MTFSCNSCEVNSCCRYEVGDDVSIVVMVVCIASLLRKTRGSLYTFAIARGNDAVREWVEFDIDVLVPASTADMLLSAEEEDLTLCETVTSSCLLLGFDLTVVVVTSCSCCDDVISKLLDTDLSLLNPAVTLVGIDIASTAAAAVLLPSKRRDDDDRLPLPPSSRPGLVALSGNRASYNNPGIAG